MSYRLDQHTGPGSTYAYNPRAIIEKALADAKRAEKKKVGDVVKKIKGKRRPMSHKPGQPLIGQKTRGRFQVWVPGANFG